MAQKTGSTITPSCCRKKSMKPDVTGIGAATRKWERRAKRRVFILQYIPSVWIEPFGTIGRDRAPRRLALLDPSRTPSQLCRHRRHRHYDEILFALFQTNPLAYLRLRQHSLPPSLACPFFLRLEWNCLVPRPTPY